MFPVTSAAEMRGDPGENEIADAGSNTEVWALLMDRLLAIEKYRDLFAAAYPRVAERDLGFEQVYNLDGGIVAWNEAGFPVEP